MKLQRHRIRMMTVILLIVLVQVIQSVGTWLAIKNDRRLKK